nr:NADH dehydrogenase subunit 1 [Quadraceps punctatus]
MPPVLIILFSIMAVALFSAFERKLLGFMQNRVGPEKVSVLGSLQPFADGLKLLSKEEKCLDHSNLLIFYFPPLLLFFLSILFWWVFPSQEGFFHWSKSSFFLLFLFSVSVYSVVVMGWFSNSKYAALGCVRSAVQSISYEVGIAVSVVFFCLFFFSPSVEKWVLFQREIFSFFWMPSIFIFCSLMFLVEVNRSPFDLSEGESELVSGFCVEYGGTGYTLIFLSENLSLMWVSVLLVNIFFGGWWVFSSLVLLGFVWVRASLPRIRFDKLMFFFWGELLPLLLTFLGFYLSLA